MKLQNNSEQFILFFGGKEIVIPQGIFSVTDEELGKHIIYISNKWKKNVKMITSQEKKDIIEEKKQPDIIKEEVKEAKEVKPKVKEEKK